MSGTELDVIRLGLDADVSPAALARLLKRDPASVTRAIARMRAAGTLDQLALPFRLADLVKLAGTDRAAG